MCHINSFQIENTGMFVSKIENHNFPPLLYLTSVNIIIEFGIPTNRACI